VFEKLGIGKFITFTVLRKSKKYILALVQYLIHHELPIIYDEKLHPLFSYSNTSLKQKFHIDLKE